MAHDETVLNIMEMLVVADKHVIGDIMAHRGLWTEGTSAVNNSYKALNALVDRGKLVKSDGYFKLPSCKSLYAEHAQLLTSALACVVKFNPACRLVREHTIAEKGLRPDALVLLRNGEMGLCFVLEVCNHERPEYLTQKINAWNGWDGATVYMSQLFGCKIPHFDIVTSNKLKTYLEAL